MTLANLEDDVETNDVLITRIMNWQGCGKEKF
jgi:hypothetical protein